MTGLTPLLDQARAAVRVSDVAGGKMGRVGVRLRGACPVCNAGQGKTKDGPFWIDDAKGRWGCFAGQGDCARGGDAIRLEQLLRGGTAREIAERFAGPGYRPPQRAEVVGRAPAARPKAVDDGDARKAETAARIWREARPAHAGALVDQYLAARGIGEAVRAVMRAEVRYHPEVFYGVVPDGVTLPPGSRTTALSGGRVGLVMPAMVTPPRTPEGRTGGVHLTFLKADGSGKARVKRAKLMLGPQTGHGRPGGTWLSPAAGREPLIVGEGIETVGSAAEIQFRQTGRVPRMAAALSLRALSGGWAHDDRGRYDVDAPAADPERPAFTWPDAGEVWLAVDRDMTPVPVTVRGPGGRSVQRMLSADDRARICGSLATQHWQAAGANPVRVIAPPAGLDFNDHLNGSAM